jgi:RNA polymerase sigma-70 factor (ECF subfamily)
MQACRRPTGFEFDEAYLDRLRSGDWHTGQHFASYFGRLLGWRLGSRYRDLDLVEDIRQETLRRVLEATRKGLLRDAQRLESFVNSVCNRVLLEHWRISKKHAHVDTNVENIVSHSNPEKACRRAEAVRRVRSAMQSLPVRDREVLSIVLAEDEAAQAVCVRLQVSRTYARVLVHRAIGRLRELC